MYDPLVESFPSPQQAYPQSLWAEDAKPSSCAPLQGEASCEIAIIGAGYTGLSAAYHLANKYQRDVVVLEANSVGWGCSGRNAGFVIPGSGRLSLLQIRKKWGDKVAQSMNFEFNDAIDTVSRLITLGNIDCDQDHGGYLKLAHNQEMADTLHQQAQLLRDVFGADASYKDGQQISQEFIHRSKAPGGVYYPNCFSLNPLKLAQGYAALALESKAQIFCNSPVVSWGSEGNKHLLSTPQGQLKCEQVVIASNAYSGKKLHPLIHNRHFPVLSSIIVTRPLSSQEQAGIGLKFGLMVMDTRAMKYYYRLLPDGRMLFGGRGAIAGKDADKSEYAEQLLKALKQTFSNLTELSVEYFWSGWVSVAYDDYPRIWSSPSDKIHYAMGYCGSGISFATQGGKRLAQSIAGDNALPVLPITQSPLPRFPLAAFRRLGLRAYYQWSKLKS